MDNTEILKSAGLTISQTKAYLALLGNDLFTPPDLADEIGENRTSVYMILNRLEELGLIHKIKGQKIAYEAEPPSMLKDLLTRRQTELQQTQRNIMTILPKLNAKYTISHQKPGVIFFQGIEGLEYVYKEIIDNGQDFIILPCKGARAHKEVDELITKNIKLQKKQHIKSRVIYPLAIKDSIKIDELTNDNVYAKFFGTETGHQAQIIVYANCVAITTFEGGISTTVITNPMVAQTHKKYFESIWAVAEG